MKVALLITSFNRHEYLKQCLETLSNADLSNIGLILIVDDASTDKETIDLINNFECEKRIKVHFKNQNKGIKDSLFFGYNLLFGVEDYELVINLDGDAVVRQDFAEKIIEAKLRHPELIVTGFNCNTLNADGSVRHKVLFREKGLNFKRTVGGINLCINKEQYHKWIKPALQGPGNWDHNACLASAAESLPIACVEPSVIQHIGVISSMGHDAGGESPDIADDFVEVEHGTFLTSPTIDDVFKNEEKKIQLPSVTLIGIDCVDVDRLLRVADKATEKIRFGAIKILSSLPSNDPRVIKIRPINSKEDYSHFVLKELVDYVQTEHMLIIQHDGIVENPDAWKDEWLEWDYIGAVWYFGDPLHPVGNGGVSIRSTRLMQITKDDDLIQAINQPGVSFHKEEDHAICRIFGDYLKDKYDIKFAPVEVAKEFSIEGWGNPDPVYSGQFAYHGNRVIFNK